MVSRLKTEQADLHYRVDGTKDAPWLVLANSIATDMHLWDDALPYLVEHFSILRFDMRGHGQSAPPDGQFSIRDLSSDVIALMDELDIGSAHLAGISLGAMVVLDALQSHPDRVKSVTYCNAIVQANEMYKSFWAGRIEIAKSQGMAAIAEPTIERWFTPNAAQSLRNRARDMIISTSVSGFCAAAEALCYLDLENALPEVQSPVHFVAGADDAAAPISVMRTASKNTPNSRFTILSDTAHLSCLEQPQALAKAITVTSALV